MSDDQILDFFSNNSDQTCGRFRPDQLKVYSHVDTVNINPGLGLLKVGLLSLLLSLISKPASAQTTNERPKSEVVPQQAQQQEQAIGIESEFIVMGVVRSKDYDEFLPGVNVYLKGSTQGTVTDSRGLFEFPTKLKAGDVLIFSFIGFVSAEYKVHDNINAVIEIHMDLYEEIMGEVAVDNLYTQDRSGFRGLWQKVKGLF
ncbi:MAG: hypothetical protein C0490_26000 [Marivirga sp.]|nr:hypothetical protein [Marivirga sp.]